MLLKLLKLYPPFLLRLRIMVRWLILPLEKINQVLPVSGRILDVGCGYGLTTLYFALTNPARNLVGSDIDSYRLNLAKKISRSITNVEFIKQNLTGNSTGFDTIIAIDLLHHLSLANQNKFFSKIRSTLKPGGLLIIKEMNTTPKLKYYFNYLHDKLAYSKSSVHYLSPQKLSQLLIQSGFHIIKKQDISNIFYAHYLYVARF
jgi:cyclopropane fatty-acyl-phospholipid synthase-like methyltransferase